MSSKKYLDTIFKAAEDKLFRGFNLGDDISEVLKQEGKDYEFDDSIIPFYEYEFPIAEDKTFKYSVVYYAEDEVMLDQITMDASFDSNQSNDLSREEFSDLFEEFFTKLKEEYGSPKTKTTDHGEDKDIFHEWIIEADSDTPIIICLARYRDSRSDIEDAIKLEYQYYYE